MVTLGVARRLTNVRSLKLLPTVGMVACLVACGGSPEESEAGVATSSASSTSVAAQAPTPTAARPASIVPAELPIAEPSYTEPEVPEPEPEPVIVDCETGLGPVTTYWSDGTVTGYTDYCQSVHDQVLQREIDANTSVCDGTVCTYQNGGTIPDPNAMPDDRCTNQIDYANDPRSDAEINSTGELTGQCPEPIQ